MDELLGRRIPYSAQAEQSVIGSMLIDARCIPDVLRETKPEYFYLQVNRDIFDTILSMFTYGQTIDPVTVMEQMKIRGVMHDDTEGYLKTLMDVTPTAANVSEYVGIIADKALQRDLGTVASEIEKTVNDGVGTADAMLESAEQKIYALRSDRSISGLKPLGEIVMNLYDRISEREAEGKRLPGIPTGLADLDRSIMGMNKSELIIIASRPGMGKTSIALNIGVNAARSSGKKVAVFSLEMSREQLATRLLSSEGHIDSRKLQEGGLNRSDWDRLLAAADSLSGLGILIDDNSTLTVADMNAQCRRVDNLGLVIIDYLQLMQSARKNQNSENRQQAVAEMSRMLKIMAKELDVPVLCLSQLSRASEQRSDKRPMLSDLRESGGIEQDADVVIGLYRDGYYNKESQTPNDAEAIILKNRKGQTGKVNLLWLPEYTSYVSAEKRRDEDS